MTATCARCDRVVTGEAGVDPLIVVPLDEGDGKVGSIIYGACCAAKSPGAAHVQSAQDLLDSRGLMAQLAKRASRARWRR